MKRFLLVIIVLAIIMLLGLILRPQNPPNKINFGISGYSPVNFPNSTSAQLRDYFKEVNQFAKVYGVHSDLDQIEQILKTVTPTIKIPIELTISTSDASKDDQVIDILKKFPTIKYIAIGNEINILSRNDPQEFNSYLSNYKVLYDLIKKELPGVSVYATFQFEDLIGKGMLTGKEVESRVDLIDSFNGKLDYIGLTTYPHLDYKAPSEIPDDYFDSIYRFNLKLAVTETSWPSGVGLFKDELIDYNTSEDEQYYYLKWLKALPPEHFEFINWIFLNDIDHPNTIFKGLGLKNIDGTPKQVFGLWSE